MIAILDDKRLQAAKQSFAARRVPASALRTIDNQPRCPRAGDLVLARVAEVGRLERLELPSGRKAALYPGDELILAYGARYAPDAYEARVPTNLAMCELCAAGGLAGRVINTNKVFAGDRNPPTLIKPLGVFTHSDGRTVNLADFAMASEAAADRRAPVIAVFGSSMNSGKTTTAAGVIRGLAQRGLRVGAAKITGTCAGGDLWTFLDAGAVQAFDFTDMGMATTYKADIDAIATNAAQLVRALGQAGCEVVVIEIADGIFQPETAALICHDNIRALVDRWIFAADSAPSILAGLNVAAGVGIELAAVSGSVTASPLAVREAAGLAHCKMLGLAELQDGAETFGWLHNGRRGRGSLSEIYPASMTERLVVA